MKRPIIILILCIWVVAALTSPAVAQTDKPKCDPASVITAAAALKSSGDAKADLAALIKLRDQISAADVACSGMTFTGKGSKVVGPFTLPAGTYKGAVQSKARVSSFVFKAVSGYCVIAMLGNDAKEAVISADKDCRTVIEANTYSDQDEPWTITLEPLE